MKCILDIGGRATCKELALRYGNSANYYNTNGSNLGKRVAKATGCPLNYRSEDGSPRWWAVLFDGEQAEKEREGTFVWILRPKLREALEGMDLSKWSKNYWWLLANPSDWSFADIEEGETVAFTLYGEKRRRRIAQNFLDAREDDPVIGYESSPRKQITTLGRIAREQDGESLIFEKTEALVHPLDYETIRDLLVKSEYAMNARGTLFRLTEEEYDGLMAAIREKNAEELPRYTDARFLEEVYLEEEQLRRLKRLLLRKQNIILQGVPGVGKTFMAKRLAYAFMGQRDDSRIGWVQFHQSYSYEDFVMGYKPVGEGFALLYGIFYQFCERARARRDEPFFFIIDEINRGNLSKVFGELLMLLEKEYRGQEITCAYDQKPFSVPPNVYVIGLMNTADRSLAMLDYALRRRFGFFTLRPAFESSGFRAYQKRLNSELFDAFIQRIQVLNDAIAADSALGEGFRIGHSHFCGLDSCTRDILEDVLEFDIIPTLREYWFDDEDKAENEATSLRRALEGME